MTHSVEKDAGRLTEREREMLYAPDRRMDAYYYGFDPTGVPEIDAVLSAVAHAGKGYHHTEDWNSDPGEWGRYGPGRTMTEVIQAAANEAAIAWQTRPREAVAARMARVWDEGFQAGRADVFTDAESNPYRVIPPGTTERGEQS